jgi:hypothetical protein
MAGEYPRERARGHAQALATVLADAWALDRQLRNLAPELVGWTG